MGGTAGAVLASRNEESGLSAEQALRCANNIWSVLAEHAARQTVTVHPGVLAELTADLMGAVLNVVFE
jgi:hypothetical protein